MFEKFLYKIKNLFDKKDICYIGGSQVLPSPLSKEAETECLKKILGKNRVISTGGGVVVTEENHRIIKESDSVTVFIDRPPELIMGDVKTSTRPLLADGKERIMKLYSERYDKYVSLCDIRIENVGTIDDIVSGILYEVKIYENNGN